MSNDEIINGYHVEIADGHGRKLEIFYILDLHSVYVK